MKNFTIVFVMAIMCLFTSSVKAQSIGDILKGVVGSVVGDKATTETSIKGTWKYSGPACEFESSSVLAQAGGSAVATKMENKVAPILKKMGVNGIVYTFDGNGNYTSKIKKRETKGTYTFDKKNKTITFTPTYGKSYTAYVATQGSTMTLTFNSDKLMTVLKTISNSTAGLSTSAAIINSIIKNYDGMRLGFELKK